MPTRSPFVWLRSASVLAAAVLCLLQALTLSGTEASGGRLTGPLIDLASAGGLGLLICSGLLLTQRRIAIVATLIAVVACLPLLIYRIAPSLFRVTEVPSSLAPPTGVVLDPLAIAGLAAVLVVSAICVRAPAR